MTNEALKALSVEMNLQNNRATQLPLFVVQEEVRVYGSAEWCHSKERNPDTDLACEDCDEERENNDGELPEDCATDMCEDGAFNHFNLEWKEQMHHGVFLTGKACDAYIERRSYEFKGKVRSYAISAYWSDDMAKLLAHVSGLSTADGNPVSHYRV